MKWFQLAQSMLPLILSFIPQLPAVLVPVIVQGIQEAEQMTGASGADKKQHVVALVHLAIQTINATKGREVISPAVITVVDRAIDTAISIVNLVAKH
jgi:hypothetical protein